VYVDITIGFFLSVGEQENEGMQLSIETCKIVVTVAFGAVKYTDVPRSWVISLLKKYKHVVRASITKDDAAMKLAEELLERKIVEINSKSQDLRNISRCMVKRLQKL
jgi:hypothetical protein